MSETSHEISTGMKRFDARLTDKDFDRFSRLVYEHCGIKLPPHKRSMLEARLRKRLRAHHLHSFEEYADLVFAQEVSTEELVKLIDVVTTNKTDFFREPAHFDYLVKSALPFLVNTYGAGINQALKVWSAGCSTGKEPYTLAMVLKEYQAHSTEFRFDIIGTDICTDVLDKAVQGIYASAKAEPIPEALKKKYLLKSKDPANRQVRIVPELRSQVRFRRLNFMDEDFGFREPFDIIFCRNVIIYFDRPTQERLLTKLVENLSSGRYIFLGHSETLLGLNLPLKQMAPSVYRRI
ncbi:MAG: protein-glutamate O-methyltransferase [Desulfuromonadales bacterium]|nr:protein-glutamate O-methyltransferase [Desulfuromonadales bacterium]